MKTLKFWKYTAMILSIMAVVFITSSCYKKSTNNYSGNSNSYMLSGNASGSQEVPDNSSGGTATLTGSYNAVTNQLQYNVSWMGLTGPVTAMHLHGPATTGVSADVLVGLSVTTNGVSGNSSGTVVLSDAADSALLAGKVYYNFHTANYPNGEIRGQIAATRTSSGSGGGGGY